MSSISLIIPTYNRQETVLKTLDFLKLQNCEDYEVIVVDQTKLTHPQLVKFKFEDSTVKYKYSHIEEIGLPNARNIGADIASNDILIYIDDDVSLLGVVLYRMVDWFVDSVSNSYL